VETYSSSITPTPHFRAQTVMDTERQRQ